MHRRHAVTALGALLLLSACNGSSDTDPQASMPATSEPAVAADSGAEAAPGDATAMPAAVESTIAEQIETLLGDAEQYKVVFAALQTAVAANDKAGVAALVEYPLTVSVGEQRVIASANQFVQEYDRIITPAIAATITGQKFADVLVSSQGVMFGDGEVWLSGTCEDESCSQSVVAIARIQEVEARGDAGFPLIVEVTLAAAAARRMKSEDETVVVRTTYFGAAAPGAEGETNDIGMVDLGWASAELAAGDHKAGFDGSRFERNRLKFVSGAPQVNISVYSGRHASEDNILDCDPYEASLAVAASSPIRLGCKLLAGE